MAIPLHSKNQLHTAHCINLKHRQDRWKNICDQMKQFPAYFKLQRFDAIYNKQNPRIGCAESHLAQIRMAQEKNMGFIFLLEDDITFTESAYERLLMALRNVPDDWDILLCGCYQTPLGDRVYDDIYRIYYAQGTHCLLYRSTCYEKMLSYSQQPLSIDDYISYLAVTGEINLYHVSPPLAFQQSGYSDIQQKIYDPGNHHLTRDYRHYRKIFYDIRDHALEHLHQHIDEINDNHLKSQAKIVIEKYLRDMNGKLLNEAL